MSDRSAFVYPSQVYPAQAVTERSRPPQDVYPYFQPVPGENPIPLVPHLASHVSGGQIETSRKVPLQTDGVATFRHNTSDRSAFVYPSQVYPPQAVTERSRPPQDVYPYFQPVPEANPITLVPHLASHLSGAMIEISRKDLQSDGHFYRGVAYVPPVAIRLRSEDFASLSRNARWTRQGENSGGAFIGFQTSVQTYIDFDFCVDVGVFEDGSRVFSARDLDPVYRGSKEREIYLPEGTAPASDARISQFKADRRARIYQGFPPQEILEEQGCGTLKSSKSLRQWADEFWQVILEHNRKQFIYEKIVHGWDLERLRQAVLQIIHTSESFPQNEQITVTFTVPITKLYVKSEGYFNRIRRNSFLLCLSVLACAFPCIYLSDYLRNKAGPRWSVCGAAYALKRAPVNTEASYTIANGEPTHATVAEESDYPGREWIREWKPTITQCVRDHLTSGTPVALPQNS
ncbi:hypothetical protein C8J57DRAFT_1245490 [Mycena rebaudengoi]|nr:hypothetical protein C8J57DRAFT_1245490 [Mycena rebaudengoi]